MGEVWLARRPETPESMLAVKMVPLAARSPRLESLFREEVRVSASLTHRNIVRVFDAGREGDLGYIAMEWVDGLDLARVRTLLGQKGQRMPFDVAAFILHEVLAGLEHAHRGASGQVVVHCDVSPHNVMLGICGEVKLTDFGVAATGAHSLRRSLRGKLRYMAPELIELGVVQPSVDLYAAGTVMYELLTGKRFVMPNPSAARVGIALGSDVPAELAGICRGLLEPHPRRRLGSASEGMKALRSWPGFQADRSSVARWCRSILGIRPVRTPGLPVEPFGVPSITTANGPDASVTRTWPGLEIRRRRERLGVAVAVLVLLVLLVASSVV